MTNTCEPAVSTALTFHVLKTELPDWISRLQAGLVQSVEASDQTPGHLEEQLLRGAFDLQRQLLQEAAQKKADATQPLKRVEG